VDLPQPEGPTKQTNCPSSTDRFTLLTAKTLFFSPLPLFIENILDIFFISNLLN
jgi:hypothetical protein